MAMAIRQIIDHVTDWSRGPQHHKNIIRNVKIGDLGWISTMPHNLLGTLVIQQVQVYKDMVLTLKQLELYENGFLIQNLLVLGKERSSNWRKRSTVSGEYPKLLVSVTDELGKSYHSRLYSAGGLGKEWHITTFCSPTVDVLTRQLRITITEILWENVDYRNGTYTTLEREPSEWNYVVDLVEG